jgi:hypothetical protein
MPSKKRVHLQESGIISLAKSRSNLHQESWEKQVDLPNCWDNHKLCKWVGKSYKKLYCTEIITKACLLRCKITHTHTHRDHNHHWYIRTRLQCGHIFMTRYAKSHTHIDYSHHWYIRTRLQCCHIFMMRYAKSHTDTSILLVGRRSSSQVVDLARRSSILLHVVIE